MPDERLARLAARGSEAAFAAIFERHHQALHRYCHSIVGNGHDASDALQSTMLKAYRALTGETREITLKPWLYRIAHNESISLLRARRSDAELASAAHVGDPATEGVIESRDRLRSLAADLTELSEQGRGALLMRELGGLEFAEIAAALGVSAAAAKQSVYESRCVLQALQEGRAMDCDVVRRTLSDGDRRMLRGKQLRGHLRSCAGCQDFERALHERPAQLAALAPPLPLAAATAMLSGVLGAGAGGGFGTGGGLIAALTGSAKGVAGASLAKVATVAVGTTMVGGAAVVVVPDRGTTAPAERRAAPAAESAAAGGTAGRSAVAASRISASHAPTRAAEAALARAAAAAASPSPGKAAARGASSSAPGHTKSPGRSATGRARGGGPAAAPGARRAERAAT
ncbi:MAG TPA: RNA polymerase sigma factor, partial [Solirubrobacteraceae bacterium]|nr:RNA polymerase sigma factor [Solirubrobacteraceae bacterium]